MSKTDPKRVLQFTFSDISLTKKTRYWTFLFFSFDPQHYSRMTVFTEGIQCVVDIFHWMVCCLGCGLFCEYSSGMVLSFILCQYCHSFLKFFIFVRNNKLIYLFFVQGLLFSTLMVQDF
jgi:hypothetical protein